MNWETFITKLVPWTLIIMGITFVIGLVSGLIYRKHKLKVEEKTI